MKPDPKVIIRCAGGYEGYRLSVQEYQYFLEKTELDHTDSETWKVVGRFATAERAWNHVGFLLGWINNERKEDDAQSEEAHQEESDGEEESAGEVQGVEE